MIGWWRKSLETAVGKIVLKWLHEVNALAEPPTGYNPLEKIRGGLLHWVAVPFNGVDVFCQLRCPNATQIEQCGDISNISIDREDGPNGKPVEYSYDEMLQIRNYQEALCQLVLNVPTFDNIANLIGDCDFVIRDKRAELEAIKERFAFSQDSMTGTEKKTIQAQIETLELQLGFILPDDTMAFLTRWAMGNDVSQIKKITRENFLRAASLAKAHNKAPTDYLSGVFTDYNKHEIDGYAFVLLTDFMREYEALQGNGETRMVGGKKGIRLPGRG